VPVDASELASRCGVDADALERVLRLLSDQGVFERAEECCTTGPTIGA